MDLVSIIVPVYNCEKYIKGCLESILCQTYTNLEVIVIDDGSTDFTYQICSDIAKKDIRLQVIRNKNSGVSVARNIGINKSSGDIVSFVDADDIVEINYIENMIELMNMNCDMVICGTRYFDNKGLEFFPKWYEENTIINVNQFDISSNFQHISVWGMLLRKELVVDIKFDDKLFVGEDALYFFMCLKRCNQIGYSRERLYNYRIMENSASKGQFSEKKYTEISAWNKITKLFKNDVEKYDKIRGERVLRCIHVYNLMCLSNIYDYNKEEEVLSYIKSDFQFGLLASRNSRSKIELVIIKISPKLYRIIYRIKEKLKKGTTKFNRQKGKQ